MKHKFLVEGRVSAGGADRLVRYENLVLIGLGFVGILSALPVVPSLIRVTGETPEIPVPLIQLLSTLQSLILLVALVMLGYFAARRVGLRTPLLSELLLQRCRWKAVRNTLGPALIGGILGGVALSGFTSVMLPRLPESFVSNAMNLELPLYTKLLYGGVTEEILVRWGIMSFFVWLSGKTFRANIESLSSFHFVLGIVAAALLFAAGHLPIAYILSTEVTATLKIYIILGNSIFGIIAGLLFWRRGLESAIVAHMVTHLAMTMLGSGR